MHVSIIIICEFCCYCTNPIYLPSNIFFGDYLYFIQDLKNIKNVKGCRDGMPKSICKQGKNDITVEVNLQSLIPTSFSH